MEKISFDLLLEFKTRVEKLAVLATTIVFL